MGAISTLISEPESVVRVIVLPFTDLITPTTRVFFAARFGLLRGAPARSQRQQDAKHQQGSSSCGLPDCGHSSHVA